MNMFHSFHQNNPDVFTIKKMNQNIMEKIIQKDKNVKSYNKLYTIKNKIIRNISFNDFNASI